MAYETIKWKKGDVISADKMNQMDEQIALDADLSEELLAYNGVEVLTRTQAPLESSLMETGVYDANNPTWVKFTQDSSDKTKWTVSGTGGGTGSSGSCHYFWHWMTTNDGQPTMPAWCIPGNTYTLEFSSNAETPQVRCRIYFYKDASDSGRIATADVDTKTSCDFTVPAEAVGIRIYLHVTKGTVVESETVTIKVRAGASNVALYNAIKNLDTSAGSSNESVLKQLWAAQDKMHVIEAVENVLKPEWQLRSLDAAALPAAAPSNSDRALSPYISLDKITKIAIKNLHPTADQRGYRVYFYDRDFNPVYNNSNCYVDVSDTAHYEYYATTPITFNGTEVRYIRIRALCSPADADQYIKILVNDYATVSGAGLITIPNTVEGKPLWIEGEEVITASMYRSCGKNLLHWNLNRPTITANSVSFTNALCSGGIVATCTADAGTTKTTYLDLCSLWMPGGATFTATLFSSSHLNYENVPSLHVFSALREGEIENASWTVDSVTYTQEPAWSTRVLNKERIYGAKNPGYTITAPAGGDTYNFRISIPAGWKGRVVLYPQVELGDHTTEFEPYTWAKGENLFKFDDNMTTVMSGRPTEISTSFDKNDNAIIIDSHKAITNATTVYGCDASGNIFTTTINGNTYYYLAKVTLPARSMHFYIDPDIPDEYINVINVQCAFDSTIINVYSPGFKTGKNVTTDTVDYYLRYYVSTGAHIPHIVCHPKVYEITPFDFVTHEGTTTIIKLNAGAQGRSIETRYPYNITTDATKAPYGSVVTAEQVNAKDASKRDPAVLQAIFDTTTNFIAIAAPVTETEKIEKAATISNNFNKIANNKIFAPEIIYSRKHFRPVITFIDDDTSDFYRVGLYHDIMAGLWDFGAADAETAYQNDGTTITKSDRRYDWIRLVEEEDNKFHYRPLCSSAPAVGNYAVIPKRFEDTTKGEDMLTAMLNYEIEGFGMLYHVINQFTTGDNNTTSFLLNNRNLAACYQNVALGLRKMADTGFTNYRYWVSPYGVNDPDMQDLAKHFGLQCLISTGQNAFISNTASTNRYDIPRYGLSTMLDADAGTYTDAELAYYGADLATGFNYNLIHILKAVEECAKAGGWMIVTTHANSWRWPSEWAPSGDDATSFPSAGYHNSESEQTSVADINTMAVRLMRIINWARACGMEIQSFPIAFEDRRPLFYLSELM